MHVSCQGPSADITELWAALQDSSVELQAAPCDIGVLDAVQDLAKKLREDKKQIAGLIHLAAVLAAAPARGFALSCHRNRPCKHQS